MRTLFLTSISALLLSACLTTQENPNYELSTVYKGDPVSSTQYASTTPLQGTSANYQSVPAQPAFTQQASTFTSPVTASQPTTYESAPVYAHPAPQTPGLPPSFNASSSVATSTAIVAAPSVSAPSFAAPAPTTPAVTAVASAPTDSAFASQNVTGTPGFMALQSQQQQPVVAQAELAPPLPEAQDVPYARLRAAGTPVPYDHNRNVISADALTTGQQIPDSVRVLQGPSQNYIVQPGDTVYSLSRKTCVGVNVIQSMNGLAADYGINIGQSIRLPASVC